MHYALCVFHFITGFGILFRREYLMHFLRGPGAKEFFFVAAAPQKPRDLRQSFDMRARHRLG